MKMRNHNSIFILYLVFAAFFAVSAVEETIFDAIKADQDGVESIRSFVEKDPEVLESLYPGEQTPLIHAVLQGKYHAVKTLLELGANTGATERDGYNILHAAGYQGRAEILQLLLDHLKENSIDDMDVSTDQHADGYYPMHRACWGRTPRHAETVEVFLANGVPHNLVARDGRSCHEMTRNPNTHRVLDRAQILARNDNDNDKDEEEEL